MNHNRCPTNEVIYFRSNFFLFFLVYCIVSLLSSLLCPRLAIRNSTDILRKGSAVANSFTFCQDILLCTFNENKLCTRKDDQRTFAQSMSQPIYSPRFLYTVSWAKFFSRKRNSEKRVEGDVISITGSLSSDVRTSTLI